jgi:hypothetical protein
MGTIANLVDAIRRVGSSSQKSALKRQDEYLSNKTVLNRRTEATRSENGTSQTFVATTEPNPETVHPFDADELRAIEENAAQTSILSERYLGRALEAPTPEHLDAIFRAWAHSGSRTATSDEEIVQILGAAFGQYCVKTLNMEWAIVTDTDGSAAAIKGVDRDFRGYPFHSTWKRIADAEQDFFVPIFNTLKKWSTEEHEP